MFSVEKVAFEIESKMHGNKKVMIQALVPQDKNGKIPDSASNVVFYAPHIGRQSLHTNRTGHDQRVFWELCENFGMTVFTAGFRTKLEDLDNRKKCYYYIESGSPKVVFEAREKLLGDYKIAKKKMFVIGNSGGSSLAERLGLLYPNDIAAVAMIGGGRFDPVQRPVNIPWLILNTRGDPRAPQNVELAQQLRGYGMNALYAETEPRATKKEDFLKQYEHNFHHTSSDLGFDLIKKFIVGIIADQGYGSARPVPPSQWPLVSSTATPFLVRPAANELAAKNSFTDNLFFPSQDFANVWQTNPYRSFLIPLDSGEAGASSVTVCVRYPPSGTASKGVVVFNSGRSGEEPAIVDYMDYMALRGYVSVTCPFSSSEKKVRDESKFLLKAALKLFSESALPFYLVGLGSGGRHMILASTDSEDSRIKGVVAIDAELDWPFPELSAIKELPNSKVANFFLVSSSDLSKTKLDLKAFQEIARSNNKTTVSLMVPKILIAPEFDGLDAALSEIERPE